MHNLADAQLLCSNSWLSPSAFCVFFSVFRLMFGSLCRFFRLQRKYIYIYCGAKHLTIISQDSGAYVLAYTLVVISAYFC